MRLIKRFKKEFSQLNQKSMVLEPKDTLNSYNRKNIYNQINEEFGKQNFYGKATLEGLNYFKSRNKDSKVKSRFQSF